MTKQMLQDYIELLEAEKLLDARHVKYLAMAKEELAKMDEVDEIPIFAGTIDKLNKLKLEQNNE